MAQSLVASWGARGLVWPWRLMRSTTRRTASTGVLGTMPWPRLKMWLAVTIGPGEMFVVPRGVEHKPFGACEVKLMLIEPKGV